MADTLEVIFWLLDVVTSFFLEHEVSTPQKQTVRALKRRNYSEMSKIKSKIIVTGLFKPTFKPELLQQTSCSFNSEIYLLPEADLLLILSRTNIFEFNNEYSNELERAAIC